jgi:hypothetical protein
MASKQNPDPSLKCQHPRNRRYYDRHTGDRICQDCGTVVGGDYVCSGPYRNDAWNNWRSNPASDDSDEESEHEKERRPQKERQLVR